SIAQTCPKCGGSGQSIQHPCKKCHGEGRVEENARIKLKIPAGVDTGSRLRSAGQGEAGPRGGKAGDLYVVLSVASHPVFQREEEDLFCEVPVSFTQLALGAEISVPSLDGELKLKIPAGTASDKVFRLRDQGVPALEQFARLCDESTHPEGHSFLEKARKLFKG
ncbi:MAG: molecular chaperone DnaJ, partial [Verrucomicrobia bacterium]|nr:molecular chaperone DnaJ [Verrucomicrobiota bacterium]